MKKTHKIILIIAGAVVALLVIIYFAIACYYRNIFGINTWINGVFCTGRTVADINAQLAAQTGVPSITIKDPEGVENQIDLNQCGYTVDFTDPLMQLKNSQNPFLWILRLFRESHESIQPTIEVDEAQIRRKWEELVFVKDEENTPGEVRMKWTKDGYQLEDTMLNRLDMEKALERLEQLCRLQEDSVLDLTDQQYYVNLPYTAEQQEVFALQEKIEDFMECRVTLDMGAEKIQLTGTELLPFLAKTEEELPLCHEDALVLDETAVESYTEELLEEYNTYGKERKFQSTRGDLVTVPAGTYGTELDGEAELEYLKDVLSRCVAAGKKPVKETHTPKYLREAYSKGENDIGDTYIEVDMTEQKMYFYKDGELLVETDIVTGNLARNNGTPQGVYYVYAKQTNRILRGRNYASHVDYWMPIYKAIGIHDASWRGAFGGNIYKTDGSHGCINTPRKYMTTIYENAEVGTPVVVFY